MTEKTPRRGRPPGREYPIQARINLSEELLTALKRLAKRDRCSQSELVRRLIADYARRSP